MKPETTADDAGDLVRGSGNVFRDLSLPAADLEQLRATLAAHVIKVLNARCLSVRDAEKMTGTPYADFSRIRNVKLKDPMMIVGRRLGNIPELVRYQLV
ncbi:XRE family transcriptional regulator [Lichenifustis flavocetrariae]|uniref:Helix-turn-helix domain-containing protein n=1 Tax=Lichenifustis flavocetrariae TaxID=2949735 RepID=A0AA42CLY8_9HYPH|nr:XRE family transcriptional regulator [Lichenifustis flavocetrariae]MCW6512003.1 helix-turn-helix domain-containing protein [Lichenifustis flavocetrariae]